VAHYVKLFGVIGSPAFPVEPQLLRERIRLGIERSYHPQGTMRQMLAIAADDRRHQALARIQAPTLVLHGLSDRLVPPSHGRDTAHRVSGARFIGIEGMGHDFAPGAVDQWIDHLITHLQHEHP
jgi:pimeloyl-ACP methyl ester carboxylesterase